MCGEYTPPPHTQAQLSAFCMCINVINYKWIGILRLLSGEGDGTPLQYSCLETPMDGAVW